MVRADEARIVGGTGLARDAVGLLLAAPSVEADDADRKVGRRGAGRSKSLAPVLDEHREQAVVSGMLHERAVGVGAVVLPCSSRCVAEQGQSRCMAEQDAWLSRARAVEIRLWVC